MFKGLRTKIESEQQSQSGKRVSSQPSNQINTSSQKDDDREKRSSMIDSSFNGPETSNQEHIAKDAIKIISQNRDHPNSANDNSTQAHQDLLNTVATLKAEIFQINRQLESVIKEKDESNDQNAQLYQLIEKLRRCLDLEKETNASLQSKLEEAESALREISQTKLAEAELASKESLQKKATTNISIKVYDPTISNDQLSDNDKSLRQKVNELQNQMVEKNRQLKIRRQNLIDIKKALQKEMHEHLQTQKELSMAQNQLKQQGQNMENGFSQSDTENKQKSKEQDAIHPRTLNDAIEETRETTMLTPQLDMMSCLSRSSASVDDFDSNDPQYKEVNLEYLRNVLYRYMTTTDTETAQHLVKALSVLMNFTPEQTAAVKSAMHSRSSWLRLK